MSAPYLIRATLRRDGGLSAIAPLLLPDGAGAKVGAAHRLVWVLFGQVAAQKRDFLWRQIGPGRFLILGEREPEDPHGLFDVECKPFAPVLSAGQRIRFDLRVNATISAARGQGVRGRREGLLAHHLRAVPPSGRQEAARGAALGWLTRQGERDGFAPDPEAFLLSADDTWRIPRQGAAAELAVMDLAGECVVHEPGRFLAAVSRGFGHARVFGCGLMLLGPPRG